MATFSWVPDIPAGVLRNHYISSQLRKQAIAEAKFMAHVKPEPGYGKRKGESVTIPRTKSLPEPVNPRLLETQKIPVDKFAVGTTSITVTEWGRALELTNFAEELNSFDLKNPMQAALRDQMKLSLDTGAAAAFKSAMTKYIPTSLTTGVFDTDGVPSTQATENLSLAHIAEIRDYMYSVLFAPPVDSEGNYMCLASTKALRGIKNDPDWEEWNKYTSPNKKFNSEVGKLEQVRFVEINHAQALSGALGLNGVLGEAVVFGRDAVASAIVHDPELRVGIAQDFGRQQAVAWYGILEFGQVWPTANAGEARIIHITSS
jgi:N4-gp56 family major capsid protein